MCRSSPMAAWGFGQLRQGLAMGADAVMLGAPLARATEAPGGGKHWGAEARHQTLPRGSRTDVGTVGSLEQILFGQPPL